MSLGVVPGVVVLGGDEQWDSCPTGVIVLQGSCPRGSCPQGSCPRGCCPRDSCPVTLAVQNFENSWIRPCQIITVTVLHIHFT